MNPLADFASVRVWLMHPAHLRAYARLGRGLGLSNEELRYVAEERRAQVARAQRRGGGAVGVQVLPVLGALSQRGGASTQSTAQLGQDCQACLEDPNVDALVLDMDSPGGEVYGVDEIAAQIRAMRATKPVVASVNSTMFSAAYYLGSQASEVMITPSGECGSIGVYGVHEDWSGALDQAGVKVTYVSAGEGKTDGNPDEPLTDAARQDMQDMVDRYYGMFVGAVGKGRNQPVDKVRGDWKAKTYGAKDAVAKGLADSIGTLDDAIRRAGALAKARATGQAIGALEDDVDVEVLMHHRIRGTVPPRRAYAGVVPTDISEKLAPEDTPWEKPTLGDFTSKGWDELSDSEKTDIAGHYAWAAEMPPKSFGDLKLPHHRASDGAVVWNGVSAAMGALLGARGGVDIPTEDRPKTYAHLARHYKQFGEKPPPLEG